MSEHLPDRGWFRDPRDKDSYFAWVDRGERTFYLSYEPYGFDGDWQCSVKLYPDEDTILDKYPVETEAECRRITVEFARSYGD